MTLTSLCKKSRATLPRGYVSVAPELYHRDGPDCQDDGATRLRDMTIIENVNGAVDFLRGLPSVQGGRLGIVGFCMGGRVAYLMATVNPSLKAYVPYYGGGIFSAQGESASPFEQIHQMHCPILGHFEQEDVNPSSEDMRKLDAELMHGKDHEFHSYPGAGHAFMDFSAASYRPDAYETSWPRTLDFLKRYL